MYIKNFMMQKPNSRENSVNEHWVIKSFAVFRFIETQGPVKAL